MPHSWLKTVFPIAAIFSFRMLGLFMLIPVFTTYAVNLDQATPTLIGVALGSYGLSQGILQIPFGMLSDRWGRKSIITLGLILFAIGSLYGALTHSIYGMIMARILQGMGAIGSVLIALLADLTDDSQRTKAMAVIGTTIGLSFSLAIVISPAIAQTHGLSGIFYFTAILACLGILLLHTVIPTPVKEIVHSDSEAQPKLMKQVLQNRQLQQLNIGIFSQHFILTSTFFVLPLWLKEQIQQQHLSSSWQFYLPILILSFLVMVPCIVISERKQKVKPAFLAAIALTGFTQLLLAFSQQIWLSICISMFFYFVGFNFLEANLPSLVSKQSPSASKGTALGVYSTCQFLGIFAGGTCAGIAYQLFNGQMIFILNTGISLLWFLSALKMIYNYSK